MTPSDQDPDAPSPSRRPPPPEDTWLQADVTRKSLLRRLLVVLVAVAVGALWLGSRPGPAALVVLVSPGAGSRVEGGAILVWRSVPGATEYQVDLVTEGGRVLHSSVVVDTTVTLGSEVTSPGAAQVVRWSVVALIPGGDVEWSGARDLVVGGR